MDEKLSWNFMTGWLWTLQTQVLGDCNLANRHGILTTAQHSEYDSPIHLCRRLAIKTRFELYALITIDLNIGTCVVKVKTTYFRNTGSNLWASQSPCLWNRSSIYLFCLPKQLQRLIPMLTFQQYFQGIKSSTLLNAMQYFRFFVAQVDA